MMNSSRDTHRKLKKWKNKNELWELNDVEGKANRKKKNFKSTPRRIPFNGKRKRKAPSERGEKRPGVERPLSARVRRRGTIYPRQRSPGDRRIRPFLSCPLLAASGWYHC